MAATDQTFRKLKTMHVVFGVSCVLMLISVIWMFVQDYNKEFKPIQRKFRDVEEQSNLRAMLQQLPRGEDLQEKINAAENARQEYAKAQTDARAEEKKYAAQREIKDSQYRTIKASFDAESSYYNIAVEEAGQDTDPNRKGLHEKEIEHHRETLKTLGEDMDKARRALDKADLEFKDEVTKKLSGKKDELDRAEDDLKRTTGAFDRFAKATAQKGWKFGDTFRALPIIDGFESPEKIKQIVLNDLTIDYGGFRNVPRYDRCMSCHLGIDRAMFDKGNLTALTQPQPDLEKSLKLAKGLLLERQRKGEPLGFDPTDLPDRPEIIKLTKGEITQYAAHPRLDLFVDGNSPHASEKFGCTICHQGQGSATSFTLASHTPADSRQTEEWKKNHDWESIHDWDFPMHSNRFIESSCLQCHHQVTDLIRYGSKEEAPKLLKGYNLVKDNGCFGCHEISGIKGGRPVGPDLRLEASPSLELLSAADQDKAKADALNPPGTMRKVGPSLRRLSEKTNEEWTRKWIQAPRAFREDTKMPHFYGLSNNKPGDLPGDQKKFPDAEMHAITHYLFTESKDHLDGKDTYRRTLLATIDGLYDLITGDAKRLTNGELAPAPRLNKEEIEEYKTLNKKREDAQLKEGDAQYKRWEELDQKVYEKKWYDTWEQQRAAKKLVEKKAVEKWAALDRLVRGGPLVEKERKDLGETTRNFANLAILSMPNQAMEINTVYAELKLYQERLQELRAAEDTLRRKLPPEVVDAETAKSTEDMVAKVKATTAKLVALAKPVGVKDQVVDYDGKPVAKDTIMPVDKDPKDRKDREDRGRRLFTEKGCLACHSHQGTEPAIVGEAQFGPNLSRVAAKLATEGGNEESKRRWLVQWLLNPNIHHPRTRMPVTFLKGQDASDIASWLLSKENEVTDYKVPDPIAPDNDTLVEMARLYLSKAPGMTAADVDRYLPKSTKTDDLPAGITDKDRQRFIARDADEQKLFTEEGKPVAKEDLLWYVGKKSISRLGCYGCHEIPGFESAKPIGTALNDWGKKDPDRLAFEDSEAFVKTHFNIVESRDDVKNKGVADPKWKPEKVEKDGEKRVLEPYEKYFADGIEHHSRPGFLSLKLAEPRSYDYKRLRTWDDRLRMPQFQFSRPRQHKGESADDFEIRRSREEAEAREAVMTFVLGLTADPIPLKYVNNPNPDRAAEVRGRQVIDKYNCAGCHQLRPGAYEFKPTKDTIDQLEKSFNRVVGNSNTVHDMPALKADHLFPMHNAWVGNPSPYPDRTLVYGVNPKSDEIEREDNPDARDKVLRVRLSEALRFTNNQEVVRDIPASSGIVIPQRDILSQSEPWGGRFVQLLVGTQNEDEEWQGYLTKKGAQYPGKPDDATSTLPPPLIREGERVQTKWLYQFLLNPMPIRPETHMKLRMPRFNMSPEESQAIVNYFAASSKTGNPGVGLTYPYETVPQRDARYWATRSQEYIEENKSDKAIEARARAELKDLEALLADLKKAEKKDEKAIDAMEKRIKTATTEIDKKNWDEVRKRWLTSDVYAKDAYKLLTNRNICLKCHNIGDLKVEGAVGPPLDLAAERLRPEWTQQWISNPKRMFPYDTQMPQNFPNDQKDDKGLSKQWLESFSGSPRDQARAARDALMNLDEVRKAAAK